MYNFNFSVSTLIIFRVFSISVISKLLVLWEISDVTFQENQDTKIKFPKVKRTNKLGKKTDNFFC